MLSIRPALVAVSVGLALSAIAPAGDAASYYKSAYGAFRPISNSTSQSCVVESSGGALNQCSSTTSVTLTFDLMTDIGPPTPVMWVVRATSFGSASAAVTCRAIAQNQLGTTSTLGTPQTFAPSGIDTKTFVVATPANHSLRLQCMNVPRNKGILGLFWSPIIES